MKQSRAIQRAEYNFESTGYDNSVSQAGLWKTVSVLAALWQWHLTLMTRLPVASTFLQGQQVFYNFSNLIQIYTL